MDKNIKIIKNTISTTTNIKHLVDLYFVFFDVFILEFNILYFSTSNSVSDIVPFNFN